MSLAYDWVQVVDPRSSHTFFANPMTGECLADKPESGVIKTADPEGEWWELWDDKHQLPYYYHTQSGETLWDQPVGSPVISLIKIQKTNKQLSLRAPEMETGMKRNSRSLDLPSKRHPPVHQHTRSTSDGGRNIADKNDNDDDDAPLTAEEARDSLSAALPGNSSSSGFFGKWRRPESAAAAVRPRRFSNMPWRNFMIRSHSAPRNSIAVSCPAFEPSLANKSSSSTKNQSAIELSLPSSLLDQAASSSSNNQPSLPSNLQRDINQFAIDGFAKKYFATHKRGIIFRRRVPMSEMLQWTKDSLKQPLIMLNKDLYRDALKCFKYIQTIMGDRPRSRGSTEVEEYQTILACGIDKGQMRDEVYVQVVKQLHSNPSGQSIRKGWEILCAISVTFPPSKNLESYLFHFVNRSKTVTANDVNIFSEYVSTRLKRICARGAKGKVLTAAEIERAKEAPFKPSVFGESLDFIMTLPAHAGDGVKIPKIVPFLADAVLQLNGRRSEGIFRVPGDAEEVTDLRVRIENGNYDVAGITDPNVPASLLKYWLRDLAEPLITPEHYDRCIRCSEDIDELINVINSLPPVNRRIVMYMIFFLQEFTDPEVSQYTRMNVSNLAMVYAPNFLRCPSDCLATVFENTKYEQAFVKTLITELAGDKQACIQDEEAPLATRRRPCDS